MSVENRLQILEADKAASTPINQLPNMGTLVAGSLIAAFNPQTQRTEYISETAFGGGGSDPTNNILVKTLYVDVDFNAPVNVDAQIATYLNNLPQFIIDGNTLQLFVSYKITNQNSYSGIETHLYALKTGKGTYGIGSGYTLSPYELQKLSITSNNDNTSNVIDLGEIGIVDPIEDVINTTGSYDVYNGVLNVFTTTRNGDDFDYIYIGDETEIGLGSNQTVNDDFISVDAVTPSTPAIDASYYDSLIYRNNYNNDLSNFTMVGQFMIIETLDGTNYFVSNSNNTESFGLTRLYVIDNQQFINLGELPDITDPTYDAWIIPNVNGLVNGNNHLFNFWQKRSDKGGIQESPDSDEEIDYLSVKTEVTYDPVTEEPNTVTFIEEGSQPTGWVSAFLSTGQSLTASTDNLIDFTGATFESDGGLNLIDTDGTITPLQEGDLLILDFAFSAPTPGSSNSFLIVKFKVDGDVFRSHTKSFKLPTSTIDYTSVSWSLPVGLDFFTNGGQIYVNPDDAITISNKYLSVSRAHKKRNA